MTISIIRTDMTADEKPEASHDYNFYLDRQLQNKLLEQDEILEASELYAKLTGANDSKTLTTKAAFAKADAIIGWINDSKVVLRKPDRESSNSNKNSNPIPNGYQMWKDARNKNLQDSYVFKHYYDTHGYIEQYRRDHTNVFIYRSPTSIQSMQGEGAQRYSQQNNNAPPVTSQVSHQQTTPVCSHCNSSNNVPNYLAALQYTNRCSSIVGGGNPYTHSPYSCYPTSQTPGGQSVYSQQTNSTRPSAHGSHSSLSQRNSSYHKHSHQPSSSCRKHRPPVDSASQAFKYKLAPETYWGNTVTRSDSQNSLESDKTSTSSGADAKTSRVGSAKGGKTPTKVSVPAVPAIQNQIQTVSVQNPTVRAPETPISTTVRALDTLACVAGDKQQNSRRRGFSENFAKKIMTSSGNDSQEDDLGMFVSDDGSDDFLYSDMSDAISISQLSTACLGADVRVKRDTDDLEPSCTFHVFPNEYALDNTLSVLNTRSVTWYPASSSVLSTPKPPKKEWNNFQTSLKNFKREGSKDFQNEPPESNRNISSRASRDTPVKRTQSEGKLELPLIMNDSKVGRLVASDIQLLDQVIFKSDKKDLDTREEQKELLMRRPKTEKQKFSKYVPEGKARQMKGLRQKFSGYVHNSRSTLRKSTSAPNFATNEHVEPEDVPEKSSVQDKADKDSPKPEIPIPSPILRYLKSSVDKERPSQSSQSQRSTSSKRRLADQKSLEKVAEYLLSERNILIGGSPREPPGIKTDIPVSEGNPKDEHPHMEGMTWCEKLELLRSVNKRKEKPKTKVQKLTYFKESEDNPLPAPLVREATRAQLYEQRRIKHLLQQARMKGFNHFDWLKEYESQRFRHSGSTDSSSDSDSDNGEGRTSRHLSNCRMGYNDGVLLSRYNMKKSVKGDNRKAVPSINRTNTEIFQD